MNHRLIVAICAVLVSGVSVAAEKADAQTHTQPPTEAQSQDTAALAGQKERCKASPDADCVISLALAGANDELPVGSVRILKLLTHAGRQDLVEMHLRKAAEKTAKSGISSLTNLEFVARAQDAARQMADWLCKANITGATPEETKARLIQIEDVLFETPEFPSEKEEYTRAHLYKQVAALLTDGMPTDGQPLVTFNGPVERWVRVRRLAKRYGQTLNVFVDRWKEVIDGTRKWGDFARSMIAMGKSEDAGQALRKIPKLTGALFNTVYCSRIELWLDLGRPSEADAMLQGTNCNDLRAKAALQYAQKGDRDAVQRLADDILREFKEEQWREMGGVIYFVPMGPFDTMEPLVNALMLSGDTQGARLLAERWRLYCKNSPGYGCDARAMATLLIDTEEFDKAAELLVTELQSKKFEWNKHNFPGFEFYRIGQLDRLAAILKKIGLELPNESAREIYMHAVDNGRGPEIYAVLEGTFGLKDAYLLHYIDLAHQLKKGDETAAMKTLTGLLNEEKRHTGPQRLGRYLYLLRLAVAMENRALATEIVQLMLDDFSAEDSLPKSSADQVWAEEMKVANLIEAAVDYAQMPQ